MTDDLDPFIWVRDPGHPDAGESLGLLIHSIKHEQTRDDYGEKGAETQKGQAITEYGVLQTLGALPEVVECELVRRAKALGQSGLHHSMPGEFSTVREALDTILGNSRAESIISDASFVAEMIVPWMERQGLGDTAGLIGKNGGLTEKIRAAIPQIREALETAANPKEVDGKLKEIISQVNDPAVSAAKIRERNPAHAGRIQKFEIQEFQIDGDTSTLVIRVDQRQRGWIEHRLGEKAGWVPGAKWWLHPELGNLQTIIGSLRFGDLDPLRALKQLETMLGDLTKAINYARQKSEG